MSAAQVIVPESESHWLSLRAQDLTSTEVAALFGLSPFQTIFEVWHRKSGGLALEFEETERTRWGTRLQDSIAQGIAEDEGWKIRRMSEYMRVPDLRIGSSFDFSVDPSGLLEVKNVDGLVFKNEWNVDGDNIEAPAHIELQVQHQLLVSGRKEAHLGALIGGNKVILIKREPDEKIQAAIKRKASDFWNTVAEKKEPKPDFSRDSDLIARIYLQSDKGKIFDARGNSEIKAMAADYLGLNVEKAQIETRQKEIKSRLLATLGDAAKAIGDGFTISAGTVDAARIEAYDRAPYRRFMITAKKEKS